MRGWNFFFEKAEHQSCNFDDLDALIVFLNQGKENVSHEEWYENLPESRQRMQQKTLGFFCGDLPNMPCTAPNLYADLPAFSFRKLELDYDTLPKCWTDQSFTITVETAQTADSWKLLPAKENISYCVDGMISREPGFTVRGCTTFLFSKYLAPKEKIIIN